MSLSSFFLLSFFLSGPHWHVSGLSKHLLEQRLLVLLAGKHFRFLFHSFQGRSYRRTLVLNFQTQNRAFLSYFQIFLCCSKIGMLSVPEIFPSVKFPKFGDISCFPVLDGKKGGNLEKRSMRTFSHLF